MSRSRRVRVAATALLVASAATMVAFSAPTQTAPPDAKPRGPVARENAREPARDGARDGARDPARDGARDPARDGAREDMFRRGGQQLPPDMVERVIAVAHDVSPTLGKQLEERRNASPEEMALAMRQNGRRLIALAVLREKNAELYQTRVLDLRLQMELHALGAKYMAAVAAGNTADAKSIEAEIATKARQQVQSDLKARGQELKALADQLESMRSELREETGQVEARVAERIEAVKTGQPYRSRSFKDEGGPRGEGRGAGPGPAGPGPVGPGPAGAGPGPGAPPPVTRSSAPN